MRRVRRPLAAAGLALLTSAACGEREGERERPVVRLAVAPQVADSGLLAAIVDSVRVERGISVLGRAVEPSEAEGLAERGEADVLVTNSAATAESLRRRDPESRHASVWKGRFVLVGSRVHYGEGNYVAERGRTWPDLTFSKPYVGDAGALVGELDSEWFLGPGQSPSDLDLRLGLESVTRTGLSAVETLRFAAPGGHGVYVVSDETSHLRTRRQTGLVLVLAEAPDLVDLHVALVASAKARPETDGLLDFLASPRFREVLRRVTVEGQRVFFGPDEEMTGLPFGRLDRPFEGARTAADSPTDR
jgi:ABC-type tungstate transport system permease subunit